MESDKERKRDIKGKVVLDTEKEVEEENNKKGGNGN